MVVARHFALSFPHRGPTRNSNYWQCMRRDRYSYDLFIMRSDQIFRVAVLAGSVGSAIGLKEAAANWPQWLREMCSCKVYEEHHPMLTINRALPYLIHFPESEIFMVHFGTTVGWPIVSPKITNFLRPDLRTEYAFHLSHHKSARISRRMKHTLIHGLRNIIKILAFPFGLYRPRTNMRDVDDQLKTLVELAHEKAQYVFWLQHRTLGYRRLFLERIVYRKFYKRITSLVEATCGIELITIPDSFMIQENYLLDGVHLSELGHERLAQIIHDQVTKQLFFS